MTTIAPPWFSKLNDQLVIADLVKQLPGKASGPNASIQDDDIRRLLGVASALALSDQPSERIEAYEVASRVLELFGGESKQIIALADLIFSRLGNFPGRTLLRRRHTSSITQAPQLPAFMSFERIAREIENTIGDEGKRRTLTDFQFRLYDKLGKHRSVSVSAPTSAGKSFVLGLDLLRRLAGELPKCVVYVVPTRALIREVSLELRRQLRSNDLADVPVRTVPFPIPREKAPKGAVFVLTQERLLSFLHSKEEQPWITTLIVDEAQGVRDEARGIILQSAIEAVAIAFPDAEIHFASPLSKNPEALPRLIQREDPEACFVETVPPVSQNLFLVNTVKGKPKLLKIEALVKGTMIDLGQRTLDFKMNSGVYASRAAFARAITAEDDCTVMFANRADDAEDLAEAMVSGLPEPSSIPREIEELIEFIRTDVHPDYPLIKCLPHGIAYHYGPMPAIVRSKVEDLCRARMIKIVCCTSTLLQGVNLPTKNIVIENPKRGSKPMERRDFLNLAGRAGRLLQEFHGNIWCLRTADWDAPSYEGEPLQVIETAVDVAMADGGTIIQDVLNGTAQGKEADFGEAAFGKIYSDFVRKDLSVAESDWRTAENEKTLIETERRLKELKITLPDEILTANASVRPDRLETLYQRLRSELDPRSFMPIRPGNAGSNDRLGEIIQLLLEVLAGEENARHKYLKQLAVKWIYDTPLAAIIASHVDWKESHGSTSARSTLIRALLNDLEVDIRFRLVKYFMAFCQILELVLKERGFAAESDSVEPFYVYLECGASSRVALNLIALGLSRSTALALNNKISFPEEATPEDCLSRLAAIDIRKLPIPVLCVEEVLELTGKR